MIAFLANMFGYLLNFFYSVLGNYGISIILFCLAIKIAMIPLSIKQQKTQIKSQKLQGEMKQLQFKYKNDPEKLNQATMELYKREKMSPFSGCLMAIIQMILLISVFYMVREPLSYMKKIDKEQIDQYVTTIKEEQLSPNEGYVQIAVISEANHIKELKEQGAELSEQEQKLAETFGDNLDNVCVNMNLLGIDLSKVPTQNMSDVRVYIIPVLYVISSFISMKLTTSIQSKSKKKETIVEVEGGEEGKDTDNNEEHKELVVKKEEVEDPMAQASKSMSMIMPIMAVSISFIAPLGLALYWLTNNVLMIVERLVLNKVFKDEGE